MIKYNVIPKKNPQDKSVKWYAQAAPTSPVGLDRVVRAIEKQSTVSSADIKAVLDALQGVIIDNVTDGKSVRLGDLGTFRLTIKSTGAELAEDVTAINVQRARVQFHPSAWMLKQLDLKNLSFGRNGEQE